MNDTETLDYGKVLNAVRNDSRPTTEQQFKDAKKDSNNKKTIKTFVKSTATPCGMFSLLKEINLLRDMPIVCAFGFALLKDLLDLVFGELIIFPILFSILCSIFIFMMMLLIGGGGKRKVASKFATKAFVVMGGGIVDSLPGIDRIPVETVTVCIIYMLILAERKAAKDIEK